MKEVSQVSFLHVAIGFQSLFLLIMELYKIQKQITTYKVFDTLFFARHIVVRVALKCEVHNFSQIYFGKILIVCLRYHLSSCIYNSYLLILHTPFIV